MQTDEQGSNHSGSLHPEQSERAQPELPADRDELLSPRDSQDINSQREQENDQEAHQSESESKQTVLVDESGPAMEFQAEQNDAEGGEPEAEEFGLIPRNMGDPLAGRVPAQVEIDGVNYQFIPAQIEPQAPARDNLSQSPESSLSLSAHRSDATDLDPNIDYYYTDSESDNEELRMREVVANQLLAYHEAVYLSFVGDCKEGPSKGEILRSAFCKAD